MVLPVASLLSVKRVSLSLQLLRNHLGSKLLSNTGLFSTPLLCRLHISILQHPCTKSTLCQVLLRVSSQVSTSTLPCVTPVSPLSISVPALDPITYGAPPVMSLLCPLSLKLLLPHWKPCRLWVTNSLWTYPLDQITHNLPSLRRLMMRTFLCHLLVPNRSVISLSNRLMTLTSLIALDQLDHRFHHHQWPPWRPGCLRFQQLITLPWCSWTWIFWQNNTAHNQSDWYSCLQVANRCRWRGIHH